MIVVKLICQLLRLGLLDCGEGKCRPEMKQLLSLSTVSRVINSSTIPSLLTLLQDTPRDISLRLRRVDEGIQEVLTVLLIPSLVGNPKSGGCYDVSMG